MSCYLRPLLSLKPKPIRQAIALLLLSSALPAYAVSVGQATIESQQHEPLRATIAVNQIDSKNFSATLASNSVYAQMGLDKTPISVAFVPTSDTEGKLILTSTQPISAPFADIVLDIENNGKQQITPQTLLMPLPKQSAQSTPPMIAVESQPNLPVIDNLPSDQTGFLPIPQPPSDFGAYQQGTSETSGFTEPSVPAQDLANQTLITQDLTPQENPVLGKQERILSTMTPAGTNKELVVLSEQITRRILTGATADDLQTPPQGLPDLTVQELPEQQDQPEPKATNQSNEAPSTTYVVQTGDSLWKIASHIAKNSNASVDEVMKQLYTQNPDAFIQNDINRLKSNAALSVSYEYVPSQKAIKEAVSAKSNKKLDKKSKTAQSRLTTPKALPKPQVTLVTPSKSGSALGAQRDATSSPKEDTGNNQLLSALKSTRNNTAQTAKKVNGLSEELSSATQKLQLQNEKLAQLEARLKALKSK